MDPGIGDVTGDVLIGGRPYPRVGRASPPGPAPGRPLPIDVTGADRHSRPDRFARPRLEWALRGIAPDADFWQYMSITHGGIAAFMGLRTSRSDSGSPPRRPSTAGHHDHRQQSQLPVARALRRRDLRAPGRRHPRRPRRRSAPHHGIGGGSPAGRTCSAPRHLLLLRRPTAQLRLFRPPATTEGAVAADNGFGSDGEGGTTPISTASWLPAWRARTTPTTTAGGLTAEQWPGSRTAARR